MKLGKSFQRPYNQSTFHAINAQRQSHRSIAWYLIRLNMSENLSRHTFSDPSTALLFNLDPHTSVQRLHRAPSDDEYEGEEEDRVELTNGSTDDVHVSKAVIDHLSHHYPNDPNLLTSLSSDTSVSPFSCPRGRALKVFSMVTVVCYFSSNERSGNISEHLTSSDTFSCRWLIFLAEWKPLLSSEPCRRSHSKDDDDHQGYSSWPKGLSE